jgi:putative DNA primase/helicase
VMPDIPYGKDHPDDEVIDLDDNGDPVTASDDDRRDKRPVLPAPSAPLDVARELYKDYRDHEDLRTLLAWRGGWMRWDTTHWAETDTAELRSHIYDVLGGVDYMRPIREKGVIVDWERTSWDPDKHKVANVLEAMAAIGHTSTDIDPPSWLLHSAVKTPPGQVISCTNGLLDLSTCKLHTHTPALFNVVSVPFAYDEDAPEPTAWLEFLASVWGDDAESIALLAEYVGYVLSGRTDMQKMLLLIGPTRSGKGTIARALTALLGRGHVTGPTLASLGTNFGLSPLLGKPLAVISDARLGDMPSHTVVERLLSITGEDMLTVDRKYREPWSGKLPTRFVILSNELPKFRDSSGAIANRLLILQMTASFLGREDRTLDARLAAELPGILNWALEGLDRLTGSGWFTVPDSSEDAANLMMDLASPMSAFVRDCCEREPSAMVPIDDAYREWKTWAEDNGHQAGAKSTFGRNLRAVVPEVKISQPTIGGKRVKCYTHIGLLLVHPVHDDESAGQRAAAGDGYPVHDYMHADAPDQAALVCTGCGAAPDDENPLVNGLCTGCTGESPLWAQHERSSPNGNGEVRKCGCGNKLLTIDAINSGKCKPCRAKLMAGYDR